jgi:hypothetical protein
MFLNELDGCFNDDVVEKMFHSSPRGIVRVNIETHIRSAEGVEPRVIEAPANQADCPVIASVIVFAAGRKRSGEIRAEPYGVRKILPVYGSSTGVPGGKPRTWM